MDANGVDSEAIVVGALEMAFLGGLVVKGLVLLADVCGLTG